ncbi:hypothetical protein QWY31_14925 [Cytophagales bacterium LB-30]|uniref:Response regulatory domain-containing protein n=1 Tax=Shiella aurantiaca TaxID=3058365 RepID=A0ABT8F936_9BACT|nr:hypothetical protein [Shiella aurantiaca]MDN4166803.1 hypothetical protein [Shiella aurantiaca]
MKTFNPSLGGEPAIPQAGSELVKVLMIGNNPIEMSTLFDTMRAQNHSGLVLDTSFTLEDARHKLQKNTPHVLLIDENLGVKNIQELMQLLESDETYKDIPVALLKDSNYSRVAFNGIQEYVLKSDLNVERLVATLIQAIRFRKSHLYLYRAYRAGKQEVNRLIRKRKNRIRQIAVSLQLWASQRAKV